MTVNQRNVLIWMLAASLASTIGGLPFNTLPILLGSLADSFGFEPTHIGLLGSVCFTGYLVGTLVAVGFIDRCNWRALTFTCAAGSALALLASARLPAAAQLPLWALIGFFAAMMTCLGLRIMAQMPNKERAFGMRQGIELGLVALVLFVLPSMVIAHFQYAGGALVLAAMILLLSLSAFALPRRSEFSEKVDLAKDSSLQGRFRFPVPAYWALGFFFVFGAGQIGLWAFLERLGHGLAVEPAQMGIVFAVLKLLGGAAALALALIGDRLGPRWPHVLVLGVISTGLLLLAKAQGFALYALGAWIWEVGFCWGCIYQTSAVARLDPSGRAIMFIPAAFALSSMVGPALAGQLVAGGFAGLLWLALATAVVPVVAFAGLLARRLALRPVLLSTADSAA
ncbi:Major Facilitator Superfamily protein [Pseudomonas taetrolens]|uniref:Arabinose ABC transporter permease n=1 Tax=Pseudomonas taetrolens TaxID=47884 RepID=A0A0J6GN27_PSETA|nr:MFS transporter [Pseudomonas taetrolens]KMM83005.1 arabinose ABC transporter permease [Pseudomonas taetrolens]SEC16612.1 Major Facilitator Superfamily protein [Pseudomonas taetrolens]SQF86077.1 arabinose ABC transporter permease [Pseudomonas taetrolens]VEH49153.1 arabinose ABC transporter permease [Pseudomonas taetrolens]